MNTVVYYFLMIMFYSFIGWIFECIHMAITTKELVNRGFYFGPIIPVYGIGLTLVVSLLDKFKDNFILLLVLAILIIGTLEYLISYFMEKIFKIRWWDYSKYRFNLNGRVCLNTMTIFITGAMLITYFLNPLVVNTIITLSVKTKNLIAGTVALLFIIDNIFSLSIVNRYLRKKDKSSKKDKTPEIRKYTKEVLKNK